MKGKTQSEKIIFGLKVKQLRQQKQLSFSDLSKASRLSVSYLNEIEKGKKYPKEDKIPTLADALGVSYEELTAPGLGENLAPVAKLVKSNFLNELPLELFGIDLAKVVELIASAPTRVGAFISTLLELSRNYSLAEEHFYFGALRSYLEMHNNYFQDLEDAATEFQALHKLPDQRPLSPDQLKQILIDAYDYEIIENGLADYEDLQRFRSVFLPQKKQLLLNNSLTPTQRTFEYGKEIAFNFLHIKERAYSSSIVKVNAFEEVLNHSKAIYFSVVLHMPYVQIVEKMRAFFRQKKWNASNFLDIPDYFKATPEMFYHRLTNILPQAFGIKKLYFIRFINDPRNEIFSVDRELHLNKRHQPHGNGLSEHYCRRWNGLSLLQQLKNNQSNGSEQHLLADCQISRYWYTQDRYLTFTIARSSYPTPNKNVAVTIGFLINDNLKEQVHFLNDPSIRQKEVHTTCERCGIMDCQDRVADPVIFQKESQINQIQNTLKTILEE